jgi:alkylhydroperoxidase family enzyme
VHDNARPHDWSTRNCARAFAAHPDLLERYLGFYYPYHSNDGVAGKLAPRLKELVRLRIATLNGCKSCKAARLVPGKVSEHEAIISVDQRDEEPFSDQGRAAIELAEAMALSHHDINDDAIRQAKEHFSDAELL